MARDMNLDAIRGVCIIFVVWGHTIHRFAEKGSEAQMLLGALILLIRPLLAVFLFLSGYLAREVFDAAYLGQRLKRLLIPYLIASLFTYPFKYAVGIPVDWVRWPLDILIGNSFMLYYYIFAVVMVTLFHYLLIRIKVLPTYIHLVTLGCLILNLIHFEVFAEMWRPLLGNYEASTFMLHRSLFTWAIYYFVGMSVRRAGLLNYARENKAALRVIWGATAVMILWVYFTGDYRFSSTAPLATTTTIGSIFSLTTLMAALTLPFTHRRLAFLGRISMFIFLYHMFAVYTFRWAVHQITDQHYWWLGAVSWIVSTLVTVGLYYLGRAMLGKKAPLYLGG